MISLSQILYGSFSPFQGIDLLLCRWCHFNNIFEKLLKSRCLCVKLHKRFYFFYKTQKVGLIIVYILEYQAVKAVLKKFNSLTHINSILCEKRIWLTKYLTKLVFPKWMYW